MLSPYKLSPTDTGGMISTQSYNASVSPSSTPQVSGGGYTSPTMLAPTGFSVPSGPSDVTPSIPGSGATIGAYGTSGTPVQTGDGSTAVTGSGGSAGNGGDYFQQVVDLIAAQLKSGSASAQQQFTAAPVLPASAKYGGAAGDGGGSSGGSPVKLLLVVLAVGGGLYYWFRIRKRGA